VYSGVFGGAENSLGKGPQEENYVLVNTSKIVKSKHVY
jgi:hypothetical protein